MTPAFCWEARAESFLPHWRAAGRTCQPRPLRGIESAGAAAKKPVGLAVVFARNPRNFEEDALLHPLWGQLHGDGGQEVHCRRQTGEHAPIGPVVHEEPGEADRPERTSEAGGMETFTPRSAACASRVEIALSACPPRSKPPASTVVQPNCFEKPISNPTGALRCVATKPTIEKFRVARSISSSLS